MTTTVAGVRFKKAGKIYYFDSAGLPVRQHDHVVVETVQGLEYGEVAMPLRDIDETQLKTPVKPILRIATEKDDRNYESLRQEEKEAAEIFEEKVKEHHLEMKLVSVEYTFDNKKAIFYFTADGRVDFRKLVKDLASIFHRRIELRQIGVRDEVKLFNTLGVCGRKTCCSEWLGDFSPVSIKMAKEQGLSLNSTKISGICGRLLCCLTYEDPFYREITKKMPKVGNWVTTPDGEGQVYRLNVLEEKVVVKIQNEDDETTIKSYGVDEVVKSGEKHVLANNRRQQQKKLERQKQAEKEESAETAAESENNGEEKGGHSGQNESKDGDGRSRNRRSHSRGGQKNGRHQGDHQKNAKNIPKDKGFKPVSRGENDGSTQKNAQGGGKSGGRRRRRRRRRGGKKSSANETKKEN